MRCNLKKPPSLKISDISLGFELWVDEEEDKLEEEEDIEVEVEVDEVGEVERSEEVEGEATELGDAAVGVLPWVEEAKLAIREQYTARRASAKRR